MNPFLFAVIDLSDATAEIVLLGAAMVAAAGLVIVPAIGTKAVKWGAKWCVRLYTSIAG